MIDYKTSDILEIYKNKYFDETGTPIQIGSSDFAAASVHSYVLGVLVSAINRESGNAFIDTATGDSLDGIAATWGIDRPSGYPSTIRVEFTYKEHEGILPQFIPQNDIVINHGGVLFTNIYTITVKKGSTVYSEQTLYAVENGSHNNNIPSTAETSIESGDYWIDSVYVISESGGGMDAFQKTEAGDNAFRAWLKTEIQAQSGAGTYLAYEARAKNADPRVIDVHVLRQDETGYEKGKVYIYIYTQDETGNVVSHVQNSCSDEAFRPIGDLVVVLKSTEMSLSLAPKIQITYPPQFAGDCNARTLRILDEYREELLAKIGRPFVFAELCRRFIEKDSQGVYAIDAKPLGLSISDYTTPIYPPAGQRINLISITTDIQIGGV